MPQTVTLTLPSRLYQPAQRNAQAMAQPLEEVLLRALQAALPPLDGLPPDTAEALAMLETLDNQALGQVLLETVPSDQQQELETLLSRHQSGTLGKAERERLATLQDAADLVMLRKARAAVLLRFRGQRIPTLTELHQLTHSAQ